MIGSMVALVTPFTKDFNIDYDATYKLLDWHIEEGTKGIVILGTTGESSTISNEERKEFISKCVEKIAKRAFVMVGTGTSSTQETIQRTLEAKSLGADAALVVTPAYNKPTQEGLYHHFYEVQEQTQFPIFLYNVPGRTACDLSVETVLRLSQLKHIVGIKEAHQDLSRVIKYTQETELSVLSGDDSTAYPFLLMGGHGVVSVIANIFPKEISSLVELAKLGKRVQAMDIANDLYEINQFMGIETNPVPCKWVMASAGWIESNVRAPLAPLSEDFHELGYQLITRHALKANQFNSATE